jgi:hypothetical protein
VAVLGGGTVDMLCHAAVRARNTGVLLAVCRSAVELAAFHDLEGQLVAVEAVSRISCATAQKAASMCSGVARKVAEAASRRSASLLQACTIVASRGACRKRTC